MLSFSKRAKMSELNNVFSNKSNTRISKKNAKNRAEIGYASFTSKVIPNQFLNTKIQSRTHIFIRANFVRTTRLRRG